MFDIGRDLEGSNLGFIEVLAQNLCGETEEYREKLGQGTLYPGRDWYRVPREYDPRTLLRHLPTRVYFLYDRFRPHYKLVIVLPLISKGFLRYLCLPSV
jgi:hypothetical protein